VLLPGEIGLPAAALGTPAVAILDRATVRPLVPARELSGHKGSFGRVVVAAGSPHYYGAPYRAAAAAGRSGCGLIALAVEPTLQTVLAGLLPEATYVNLPPGAPDVSGMDAARRVLAALEGAQSLLLGPGIGRSNGARAFVAELLVGRAARHPHLPLVIDADALTILASEPALWKHLTPGAVLTPHHGEMSRLIGVPAERIAEAPWHVAREWAARWGQTLVLKGPFTVVATADGPAHVLPHANAALATGGTGDVLGGTIAGLMAQKLPPADAARVAVYVHAAAANAICATRGADVLLASDLLPALSRELALLRIERGDRPPVDWVPWSARL
jgi:NAD(P)H-hydrate epimerase